MKKHLLGLLFGLFLSSSLMADFARVEMGTGVWLSTASGEKTYSLGSASGTDIATEDEETNPYIWLLIKHPIPILPNFRFEYVDVTTKGIATGTFEDFIAINSPTQLDITQYDIIPYYNLLDNTAWVTLDVGLDIKMMDVSYTADDVNVTTSVSTSYSESSYLVLPLLYTRVRLEIPITNIGLEADAKYIEYSSSTVYDLRVKLDYTLDFFILEPALEVGYRKQRYKVDEDDIDGKLDLTFSGFYAGLMIRF